MIKEKDQPLVFIHIPKTAGSTMVTIIERLYDEKERFALYPDHAVKQDVTAFEPLDIGEGGFKIYYGHMAFGLHGQLGGKCRQFTILREPVDRIVSLYSHVTRDSSHPFYHRIKERGLGLQEFVVSGITDQTDNSQTRILSNEFPPFGKCTRKMLARAKKNLKEHFLVTGLTERFDESVILMRRAFGWPSPFYKKANVSGNKPKEIGRETIEVIKRNNEFDTELYAFAEELLDKQVAEQGPSFQRELVEFKELNVLFSARSEEKDEMVRRLNNEISVLKGSLSWKITAPLRGVLGLIMKG